MVSLRQIAKRVRPITSPSGVYYSTKRGESFDVSEEEAGWLLSLRVRGCGCRPPKVQQVGHQVYERVS